MGFIRAVGTLNEFLRCLRGTQKEMRRVVDLKRNVTGGKAIAGGSTVDGGSIGRTHGDVTLVSKYRKRKGKSNKVIVA